MSKRKFGDRKDARRVRDMDGLHCIMMHIMPKRTESEVYLEFPMDVTDLLPYIEEKNYFSLPGHRSGPGNYHAPLSQSLYLRSEAL